MRRKYPNLWKPKFLRPHAWYCDTCKKFEITIYKFKPSWVSTNFGGSFCHYSWRKLMIKDQDFGRMDFCGNVKRVLAKFEGV